MSETFKPMVIRLQTCACAITYTECLLKNKNKTPTCPLMSINKQLQCELSKPVYVSGREYVACTNG